LKNSSLIVTTESLQQYFFESLSELNKKSLCPVPEEIIYYSSDVLVRYTNSENYFEFVDGKLREKVLGLRLLEATQLNRDEQKRVYREVGDTTLLLCGYFAESVNKKIIDISYYKTVGKTAFSNLNTLVPSHFDRNSFFEMISSSFDTLTVLIARMAMQGRSQCNDNDVISNLLQKPEATSKEYLINGIHPVKTKKVS
jgi:hypothetical protein